MTEENKKALSSKAAAHNRSMAKKQRGRQTNELKDSISVNDSVDFVDRIRVNRLKIAM